MARSYAELIDFLVAEIASTGQPGESCFLHRGLPQFCAVVAVGRPQRAMQPPTTISTSQLFTLRY
jgi:hypothetical protein